jgi:hypothetical protein
MWSRFSGTRQPTYQNENAEKTALGPVLPIPAKHGMEITGKKAGKIVNSNLVRRWHETGEHLGASGGADPHIKTFYTCRPQCHPQRLRNSGVQTLHKIIGAKFPPPPDPLPERLLRVSLLLSPFHHDLQKINPPPTVIPPDPKFTKQAFHPQPPYSLHWRLEVFRKTAPNIILKALPLPQHSRTNRNQMHEVTYHTQIKIITSIDKHRFLTTREDMSPQAWDPKKQAQPQNDSVE